MKHYYLFFAVLLLSSCRFLNTIEALRLQFPDRSDNLFEGKVLYWELEGRDENNEIITVKFSNNEDHTVLYTEKGIPSFFILKACVQYGDTVVETRPAGFIYPYDCTSAGEGQFSWRRGPVAVLLIDAGKVIDTAKFNIPRLIDSVDSCTALSDPWDLDWQEMLEDLTSGDFSVYDINLQRERQISLKITAGIWMNVGPGGTDIVADPLTPETEVAIRTGIHKYINREGGILEIFLYSDGTYDYLNY